MNYQEQDPELWGAIASEKKRQHRIDRIGKYRI